MSARCTIHHDYVSATHHAEQHVNAFNRAALVASIVLTSMGRASGPFPAPNRDLVSERFTDLPGILIPETVTPTIVNGSGGETVFAFVVDTTGRIELPTVQTLLATDSVTARQARVALAGVRYIPARLVQDLGN